MTKQKPTKEELYELYINQNLSRKKIAERFGYSEARVKQWLKEYTIVKPRKLITQAIEQGKIDKYGTTHYSNEEKRKATCLKRYGVTHVLQNKDIMEKRNNTCLERYGDAHYTNIEKARQTKLEKYGDENFTNIEKMKKTKLEKYGDKFFTNYKKACLTKLEKYGDENFTNIEKMKQTKLKKYGDENFTNIEKQKMTCIKRYGEDTYMKTTDFRQKSSDTIYMKYGVTNYAKTDEYKEKTQNTNFEKYGSSYYLQSNEYKQKMKERYGDDLIVRTEWFKNKSNETKKMKGTFNSSSEENEIFLLLQEKFENVKNGYTSNKYPFLCDFYIPTLDLYIELHFHWTHGGKPFEMTNEDMKLVENWINKNTKYYDNAIYTWTDLDVRKKEIAEKNKINWLVFYNKKDFMEWFKYV